MHHFFLNIINAIIDEAEKRILVIILQSNETLALEKNKWNYLLTKG
jgi:LacI family transcriptional regulator